MSQTEERRLEDSRDEEQLAQAILAYLAEHPQAMDTLQGIAEWWVLRRLVEVEVPRVAHALGDLTAGGFLEPVGTGLSRRYRARARRGGTVKGNDRKSADER
jgi:hypothetical protein